MSKVSDLVFELVAPIADGLNLELVEVDYSRKSNGMNLTVFIDKVGGVNISDCEALHNAIDPLLDELDPTQGASYVLNVSSLGLDRPLKTPRDFVRNLNGKIKVKLFAPVDGRKIFEGTLVSFDDDSFTIDEKGTQIVFEKSKVALAEPVIEF